MSVILWLNIVGNRKISRCRSIERALFFQQRRSKGSSSKCPFHFSNAFSWSAIGQPSDANGEENVFRRGPNTSPTTWQEGVQKRAWVRGWHLARLGWNGREIILKCHVSNPSDNELFFYAAIKFKIFYNKRIYLTTSTKDSYKRSKGADICSRNGARVIKLGGRQTERTKPEIRSVPLLNCPFLHFGK